MIVSAWKNDKGSFGLSISKQDRDLYIDRKWKTVILHLDGHLSPVEANIDKSSFWKKCPHFISTEIKDWLAKNNHISWEIRKPPKFTMSHIHSNEFKVQS